METQEIIKSEDLELPSSCLEDVLLRYGNLAFREAMRQTFGPDYYKSDALPTELRRLSLKLYAIGLSFTNAEPSGAPSPRALWGRGL